MEEVLTVVKEAVKAVFGVDIEPEITRPAPEFGDWATNVALKLAKTLNANPQEIATQLADYIKNTNLDWLAQITIAGPGFINFIINDQPFINLINEIHTQGDGYGRTDLYNGQNVVVEYLDPNPMKEIHIGHVYTGTVGDTISSLFAVAGANVHRVTYQGDVGLHIAKALYGITQRIGDDSTKLEQIAPADRPRFLSETYISGAAAYENDESAQAVIQGLNKKVYDMSDPLVSNIYVTCKAWSLEYFDEVYAIFGFSLFEKNYMEGTVSSEGLSLVHDHIDDGIFVNSQGAIIFPGEKYGLHTRVFVNSQGLPTYEAKDLGNAMLKWRDYQYDLSVVITGNEQAEYFKVMLKALEQFAPEQAEHTKHITHGLVKLSTGKMSSRNGQVVRALDLLKSIEDTAKTLASDKDASAHDTALAAIKYAFLKNRVGGDIIYDVDESLSLEGNSGPYLQYAHARACSILTKSTNQPILPSDLNPDERVLVVKISEFKEVVLASIQQLAPHLICTYLYDLAQEFNRFYEKNRIIGDSREQQRLSLVQSYATVLKNGLTILRIPAPDHM